MSKLKKAISEIINTKTGQERNMYPRIKTIFEVLGHKSNHILVDSNSELASGIPDLIIKAEVGIGERGKPIMGEWAVCEVKDEKEAFKTPSSIKKIFHEKSKYISIDTSFFILIDPERMIIRPVSSRAQIDFDEKNDITILWDDVLKKGDDWFRNQCTIINRENSGYGEKLKSFRNGDETTIATIKLQEQHTGSASWERKRLKYARNDFFKSIQRSTQLLQSACLTALMQLQPDIDRLTELLEEFGESYGGYKFNFSPFSLRGNNVNSDNGFEHDRQVEEIRERIFTNPSIAKLTFEWLPEFKKRVGKVEYSKKDLTLELFAIETANLILARILLLRFFEDHGFFGDKKYICNGGVKSFQQMREYFGLSYTKLLKDVYDKAKNIYFAVFEEMELDWIFGTDNESLSLGIELSLMYMSKFDFTTVKGDILTGIYDRFLEGSKRKKLGEYYTKPSIARYIIDEIGIKKNDKVFDPSCGSGTFLLESFDKNIGSLIDAGLITFTDALEVIDNIRGNDINPFSSMVAQIQMLWHLLSFKEELKKNGFPKLNIAEKHNSLVPSSLTDHSGSIYARIDKQEYDAVIGNPPYVRPERSDQELDNRTQEFYKQDITPDKNLFTLFIYRAMRSWCKPETGKLGFVIPLSFCDNNSNQKLRNLFMIGGRWCIREIVDMEAISEYVFDAAVNPIVLIAENRPATEDDRVIIQIAGTKSIDPEDQSIDLSRSKRSELPYSSIWSEDGRILTKITSERLEIINKLLQNQSFEDIAFKFWIRKKKNKIVDWQKNKPSFMDHDLKSWEQKACLSRGAVFRGKKPKIKNGFKIYKGENISATLIEGEPVETDIDIFNISDPSLWKYLKVLPSRGFVFMRISSNLTAASFNPKEIALLDTTTIFFPKEELCNFPFDLLMLSNIYQFFYGVYARMGAIEQFYSNLYPSNLKLLPWSDNLYKIANLIDEKREEFLEISKKIHQRSIAIMDILDDVGSITFKDLCISMGAGKDGWSLDWNGIGNTEGILIDVPEGKYLEQKDGDMWRVYLGSDLFKWLEVGNLFVAKSLRAGLTIYHDSVLKKDDILDMAVPKDEKALIRFLEEVERYDEGSFYSKLDSLVYDMDKMVGAAFGLDTDEICFIQKEMREDTFLGKLRPKLPFSGKRKKGLLKKLASSSRYL